MAPACRSVPLLARALVVGAFTGACSLLHPPSDYDDGSRPIDAPASGDAGPAAAGPKCTDGAKNGEETDVDCGGPCPKCSLLRGCRGPADCESGICEGSVCVQAFCVNGVKDHEETAVDCGGAECAPCDDGKTCVAARDCKSKRCDGGMCRVAASCKELRDADATLPDGTYRIRPDPAGPAPTETFCEMTTDGGGWTLIAHVNGDYVAGKLFEEDLGTFHADASDGDVSYGAGAQLLRHIVHTQAMVTIDGRQPQAKKVVFFSYGVGHPGFSQGPVPCQSLTAFGYRTALTGAFTTGGDNDKCDAQSWSAAGTKELLRLTSAGGTTKGLFWGSLIGGDNTWGHDGYWYVR